MVEDLLRNKSLVKEVRESGFMIQLLIIYLLVVPICILLHEIGHGIGAVLSSNSHAHIYLGPRCEHNKENFRLGRLHSHISWSFIGFAYWDTVFT